MLYILIQNKMAHIDYYTASHLVTLTVKILKLFLPLRSYMHSISQKVIKQAGGVLDINPKESSNSPR